MNKYAMAWTSDRGYMPGTNANLNAMELYGGYEKVDKFILMGGSEMLPEEYKAQWPVVKFVNMFDLCKNLSPTGDPNWYYVSADLSFAIDLLKNYEVVLLWGADLCVMDDFTECFEIAEKLQAMVLGTNEHGSHYVEGLSKQWPYPHTWAVPYADAPFFIPKAWASVLQLMLEYYTLPGAMIDRMDGMNYAIRDLGARVHAVPGELWVVNVPYRNKFELGRNHSLYIAESSTRLRSFHRKYWNSCVCREYLPGSLEPYIGISRRTKMQFNYFYNFFNKECRVKWTEGLEVWDGQ